MTHQTLPKDPGAVKCVLIPNLLSRMSIAFTAVLALTLLRMRDSYYGSPLNHPISYLMKLFVTAKFDHINFKF